MAGKGCICGASRQHAAKGRHLAHGWDRTSAKPLAAWQSACRLILRLIGDAAHTTQLHWTLVCWASSMLHVADVVRAAWWVVDASSSRGPSRKHMQHRCRQLGPARASASARASTTAPRSALPCPAIGAWQSTSRGGSSGARLFCKSARHPCVPVHCSPLRSTSASIRGAATLMLVPVRSPASPLCHRPPPSELLRLEFSLLFHSWMV